MYLPILLFASIFLSLVSISVDSIASSRNHRAMQRFDKSLEE